MESKKQLANNQERTISIAEFTRSIERLSKDPEVDDPCVWYKSQKEHWLGWLGDYEGSGAYGRNTGVSRDARFAYNHVVCPGLLMYLIRAIRLRPELVTVSEQANQTGGTLIAKAGAIRKAVPWSKIYQALWGNKKPSFFDRLLGHTTEP